MIFAGIFLWMCVNKGEGRIITNIEKELTINYRNLLGERYRNSDNAASSGVYRSGELEEQEQPEQEEELLTNYGNREGEQDHNYGNDFEEPPSSYDNEEMEQERRYDTSNGKMSDTESETPVSNYENMSRELLLDDDDASLDDGDAETSRLDDDEEKGDSDESRHNQDDCPHVSGGEEYTQLIEYWRRILNLDEG